MIPRAGCRSALRATLVAGRTGRLALPGVTHYSRKLLAHWAALPPVRDDPVLFCQREAAETAIFFAEVAGRHGTADYRRRLEPENRLHNDGLPRVGLKMATNTGKTIPGRR